MRTSEVVLGLVDCPRLRVYRSFLETRGYRLLSLPAPGLTALLVCADHVGDPHVASAAAALDGPKLLLGAPVPDGWAQAESLPFPMLPLDLERRLRRALGLESSRGPAYDVLVVEDDLTIAATVARGLADDGMNVRTCQGWVDLAAALARRPDFILMDLNLPGLAGEKIGSIIASRRIPTAIYSAESPDRLDKARHELGAIDAFPKDTPAFVIAARIRHHLRAAENG